MKNVYVVPGTTFGEITPLSYFKYKVPIKEVNLMFIIKKKKRF